MNTVVAELSKIGIVPVIALDSAADAKPLAQALIEGGLPCAEITFRTSAAEEAIKIMAKEFPQMLVGAGTVLTTQQADKAIAAGAKFIVSPGLNPKVVKHCLDKGIAVLPGCATPGEIEQAIELGLEVVKFFPAEAAGGLAMIKAMSAPYTNIKFMPTGGITPKNLNEYLSFNKVIACGGSWMVPKDLIKAGDFAAIKKLTKEAVDLMLGYKIEHVGINTESAQEAQKVTDSFSKFFSFEAIDKDEKAFFAGTAIEIMKFKFLGEKGHIAIATNYAERAYYHMQQRGAVFNEETLRYDAGGKLQTVYLKEDIGGFAVHIIQKK